MAKSPSPAVADVDEDPNVDIRGYASPPCYAHEIDPAYFGLPETPDHVRLRSLRRTLDDVRDAIAALSRIATGR